jgi:FkbM family methyltransferase
VPDRIYETRSAYIPLRRPIDYSAAEKRMSPYRSMREPFEICPTDLPSLLKKLYRFRRAARRGGIARLFRRRRKAALLAALARDWPGGYTLTDQGDLAFVPAPLDAQGERLLFYGFAAPAAAVSFAPKSGVVIDVGANLGEWSVPLAKAVGPDGRVLCCEPNPAVAEALRTTLRINNLTQAAVLSVALSAHDGEGHLVVDPRDTGLSRVSSSRAGIPVSLRRLDSIVVEHAIERLDFLKIDVEGCERQVFAGAIETLRRFRPAIVFESGHEAMGDRAAIGKALDDLSYDIVAVLHDYGALACHLDDYLAASDACRGPAARNILALPRQHGQRQVEEGGEPWRGYSMERRR